MGIGLCLAAAAAALFVFVWQAPPSPSERPARIVTKGGELSLTVVRQRGLEISENPEKYREGDRFKLVLTTPYSDYETAEVVVFQGEEVFFPYPKDLRVAPGNKRSIPGAFELSGTHSSTVCVSVGATLPSRGEIIERGIEKLPEVTVCRTLESEDEQETTD